MTELVAAQRKRAERAWTLHSAWDHLYQDAYDFAIPNRRPGGASKTKRSADRLFDMTAPDSAMHLAGELQRLLFSQPPVLRAGALVRQALAGEGRAGVEKLARLDRELERTGSFIYPFMEAGDLDTSTHEMCIDLGVGQGVLIPMRGTPEQPIIFHAPPQDEVALMGDAYGRVNYISWKRYVEAQALLDAMPNGNFSQQFRDVASRTSSMEVLFYQDFWKTGDPQFPWRFAAYTDRECYDFIATERYRTKPVATPRYYRVSGEMRGRGPILIALPFIKTLNKAQELTLKSAAIQMLGIWGYRAGAFNPDTAPKEPGSFWSMMSTGGVLGPDVTRLDPAAGRLDIANLVIEGGQTQVRNAMLDTRLQQSPGTPKSASEIAGLMQQGARVHLGGFMRLWREVYPDIVPRCAEILESFGYLRGLMNFNELITSVGVRSPMAAALSADKVANIARYAELMNALSGGDASKLPMHLDIDLARDEIGEGLMIPKNMIPSEEDRAALEEQAQQQQQAAVMAEMAVKSAPNIAGGAMRVLEGGRAAA